MKRHQMAAALTALFLAAGPPAGAQEGRRLSIHGYLSQAFAATDGEQILGIPEDGTTDYRRAAVLFRYELSDSDSLVIQVAQRRLGESPVQRVEPDVKFDWAFYEHRFESGTRVRAGRFAQPYGIHNETRYVGTLLPFYRTPYNIYQEGTFTSENIDGLGVFQTIAPGSDWRSELKLYGGGFEIAENPQGDVVTRARAEKALGAQLWIDTPLRGLRVGATGQRLDLRESALAGGGDTLWETFILSADGRFQRFTLQAEYSEIHVEAADIVQEAWYAYAGAKLTSKLSLHLQHERSVLTDNTSPLIPEGAPDRSVEYDDFFEDTALGLSYAFRPDVIAKAEYHWNQSRRTDPQPPLIPTLPAADVEYFILSLSASF